MFDFISNMFTHKKTNRRTNRRTKRTIKRRTRKGGNFLLTNITFVLQF